MSKKSDLSEVVLKYMQTLYEETNKGQRTADQYSIGSTVGLDLSSTDALINFLKGKGYVETLGLGGDIRITQAGIMLLNS